MDTQDKPTRQQATAPLLSMGECGALRCMAILAIVLHNYCHWLAPMVKENEYTFSTRNVDALLAAFSHADAWLPLHLLSFFGHYGVPVFLFLSAYGLVSKYERGGLATSTRGFVGYHFLKLFRLMIVGFVAFTMVDAVTPGRWHYTVAQIVGQLTMTNNLFADPDHNIWPGPYWFFGLMLQFYVAYALLLRNGGRRSNRADVLLMVALVLACTLVQMACPPESDALNRLRYNCVGGMLPFCMGLLAARHEHRLAGLSPLAMATTSIMAAVAAVACSLDYYTWYAVPLLVCVSAVALVKCLPRGVVGAMASAGGISALLFVCHPMTRKIFIPISRQGDVYAGLLLYVMASVAVAWLFARLMRHVPRPRLK